MEEAIQDGGLPATEKPADFELGLLNPFLGLTGEESGSRSASLPLALAMNGDRSGLVF